MTSPSFSRYRVAISAPARCPEKQGDPTPWPRLVSSGATSISGGGSVRSLDTDRTGHCTAERYQPRCPPAPSVRGRAPDAALPAEMRCTSVRSLRTRTVMVRWSPRWPNDRTTVQRISLGLATLPAVPRRTGLWAHHGWSCHSVRSLYSHPPVTVHHKTGGSPPLILLCKVSPVCALVGGGIAGG